jgi:hypothetical protein
MKTTNTGRIHLLLLLAALPALTGCVTTTTTKDRLVDNPTGTNPSGVSSDETEAQKKAASDYFQKDKVEFLESNDGKTRQPVTQEELDAQLNLQSDQAMAEQMLPEEEPYIPTAQPAHAPGKVISPYGFGDMVDVSGYPSGTVVKCPHTLKPFRVP